MSRFLRRWLREPLLHFLAIGTLLFAAYTWKDSGRDAATRIVITTGQVDALTATFMRTWQRSPTERELKAQLDDFVREEIAAREAMAGGLERDDPVIRRRLRQKLEALLVDVALDMSPPDDAQLQAWLDAHPDRFRREPQMAFRQIFLNPRKRGESVASEAVALRERLAGLPADADAGEPGDASLLPGDVPLSGSADIGRAFGPDFAGELLDLELRRWSGPLRSGYGLHLVFVRERIDGRIPRLDEVRPQVERQVVAERRQRVLDQMYAELLAKYRVSIEPRSSGDRTAPVTPP